jgi:D-glycero-D-manno-heptose 1,7-bisphosphate phosphatase
MMELQMAHKDFRRVPILFCDLDGTVRKGFDELGKFVNGPEDVELFPGMAERLLSYKQQGWRIVGVTNQGGIATGQVTQDKVAAAIIQTQRLSGDIFDLVLMCCHHPAAMDPEMSNCFCRKPKMGMLVMAQVTLSVRYPDEMYPPHLMMMVGDRDEDRQCAESAGVKFQIASEWRQQPFTMVIER